MAGRTRPPAPVLVTGASGYVGGRLVAALESAGRHVRCVTRRPELTGGRFGAGTEVVAGDVLDADSMRRAMAGVGLAYYLVHSLGARGHFEQEEERAARSFVAAAQDAGVRRIVYLGGLAHPDELAREAGAGASAHMSSRLRVGELLRGSAIPTVEFRASVVIGAGSLSFELIRALVQRLPVMVTPRWVSVEAQPIAIADVIAYLVAALDLPLDGSRVFEIGGAEVTSYRGLMEDYARQRGLRRLFVPVPFLTPQLSSLWLGLVTPIFARVGRKLIESITMPSVVRDRSALDGFAVRPRGYRDAIRQALADEDARLVATSWSDALSASEGRRGPGAGTRFGNRLIDSRAVTVAASPERAFAPIRTIGGARGWYHANALWRLRGVVDRLLGGVGMKRGRRDPEKLRAGDVVDCWRVVACDAPRVLSLEAEMRLPGRAWLQFEVTPCAEGTSIRQTAVFDPIGLGGLLYWYVLYLPHLLIFRGMLAALAERTDSADG
ncbi:MAG: SDR family oxidoreductase [Spirochaetaceae bacterium]|nr:SDR family oxidoreductase [Spirochaetaceae bacterium]